MDALFRVPAPVNEPVLGYAPGSPERAALEQELARIAGEQIELPSTIGGRKVMGGGRAAKVLSVRPSRSRWPSSGPARRSSSPT
jgi:1-pyrroline-5-carboxylate dehydrogenase